MKHLLFKSTLASVSSALILSGCGGSSATQAPVASKPPSPLATSAFVDLAKTASCANLKNRLFVIDQKQVFWDKAGSCADASYAQTLYGDKPEVVLCTSYDSIAGPRTSCADAASSTLFATITKNLDKADLGLGSAHQVQQLAVPAGVSTNIAISALQAAFYRGPAPINVVLKESAAWNKFWEIGNMKAPMFNGANFDFSSKMVVGTLFSTPNNCSLTRIVKVSSDGQKLTTEFTEDNIISIVSCDPGSPQASTPMNLVELATSVLPVEFTNVSNMRIPFSRLDSGTNSGVTSKKDVVIKDQSTWIALWSEHAKNGGAGVASMPAIDFTKNMVVAIFLGSKPSGCYGIDEVSVWRKQGRLNIAHRDAVPGPLVMCTANITTPAYLIELPRSEEPIDFNSIQTSR